MTRLTTDNVLAALVETTKKHGNIVEVAASIDGFADMSDNVADKVIARLKTEDLGVADDDPKGAAKRAAKVSRIVTVINGRKVLGEVVERAKGMFDSSANAPRAGNAYIAAFAGLKAYASGEDWAAAMDSACEITTSQAIARARIKSLLKRVKSELADANISDARLSGSALDKMISALNEAS